MFAYCDVSLNVVMFVCFQFKQGRLAVFGSVHMFSDQYIDKEENMKIIVSIVSVLVLNEADGSNQNSFRIGVCSAN